MYYYNNNTFVMRLFHTICSKAQCPLKYTVIAILLPVVITLEHIELGVCDEQRKKVGFKLRFKGR